MSQIHFDTGLLAGNVPSKIDPVPVSPTNPLPVTLAAANIRELNVIGPAAQTALGNNITALVAGVIANDADGYRQVSLQITPTGTVSSGVVTFEASQDNVNFVAIPLYDEASITANPVTTVSPATGVSRFFSGPLNFRYFRARISTVIGGGGSIQGFVRFSPAVYSPAQLMVTQATAANLAMTATLASTTLSGGQTAHSSASTGNPVRVGGRVNSSLDTTLVQGDAADLFQSTAGQAIVKDFGDAANDWQYAAAASGIVNTTTAVTIKAAGAAGIRNYITAISLYADALGAATEVVIRDGASGTVIWRHKIPTAGMALMNIVFPTPLKGTAATLLEVATLTASVTGGVYFNAQGYQSA